MTQFSLSARVHQIRKNAQLQMLVAMKGAVVAHAARVKNDRQNKIFSTLFRCDVQLDYTPVEFNAMHAAVSFSLQEREVRNLQEKSCTFTGMGSGKSAVD
jgi:hypothetical protein